MIRIPILIAAALLSAAPMPPAVAQPARAPVWQIDWGEQSCTLVRQPTGDAPFAFGIQSVPGSGLTSIRMMRQGDAALPRRVSAVALLPSGRTFEVSSETEETASGGQVFKLAPLPDAFWDVFASSTELQLRDGAAIQGRIPLTRTAGAARGFRSCISDALREWGVDEARLRTLQSPPRTTNFFGLTASDYPASALSGGISGQLVIRVDVTAQGRANDCAVVGTSGSSELDAATCRAVLQRGRFTPARDASGQPTAVRAVNAVAWLANQ